MTLPELILLDSYGGNWSAYLEAIYSQFKKDFVDNKPRYNGKTLGLKKHPEIQNKEYTFWHFITSGEVEEERLPDLRRCERIAWPRAIIDNCKDKKIKVWEQERKGKKNICLCYGEWEYIVVLTERKGYLLPWTAFCVERNHTKRMYEKEYNRYIKAKPASIK